MTNKDIYDMIKDSGVSQSFLSKKIGMNRSTFANFFRGKKVMTEEYRKEIISIIEK